MAKKTYIKNNGIWKEVKNVWIKVNGEWKENIIPKGIIDGIWREFIQYYVLKTSDYVFPSSTLRNRSKTIQLTDVVSIESVTTDNGNVEYTLNGNDITITVSNGIGYDEYESDKYMYMKNVSTSKLSLTNEFPESIPYSEYDYSGILYKDGDSYVNSGQYIPETTKYVEASSVFWAEEDIQPTKIYNELSYYGVLNLIGSRWEDGKIISTYGGNVTRPAIDSRTWGQSYKGYIYKYIGGYTTYYSYKVNINYKSKPTN